MRITNQMLTNNMMSNINKNKYNLNKRDNQDKGATIIKEETYDEKRWRRVDVIK